MKWRVLIASLGIETIVHMAAISEVARTARRSALQGHTEKALVR